MLLTYLETARHYGIESGIKLVSHSYVVLYVGLPRGILISGGEGRGGERGGGERGGGEGEGGKGSTNHFSLHVTVAYPKLEL
jgi:hypothetical protein